MSMQIYIPCTWSSNILPPISFIVYHYSLYHVRYSCTSSWVPTTFWRNKKVSWLSLTTLFFPFFPWLFRLVGTLSGKGFISYKTVPPHIQRDDDQRNYGLPQLLLLRYFFHMLMIKKYIFYPWKTYMISIHGRGWGLRKGGRRITLLFLYQSKIGVVWIP